MKCPVTLHFVIIFSGLQTGYLLGGPATFEGNQDNRGHPVYWLYFKEASLSRQVNLCLGVIFGTYRLAAKTLR